MTQMGDILFNKVSNPAFTVEKYFNINETEPYFERQLYHQHVPFEDLESIRILENEPSHTLSRNQILNTSKRVQRKKRYKKFKKAGKNKAKFIVPALIGFLTATSLLIPIGIKTLALVSAKALILVLLSTLTALFVRLSSLFGKQEYRRRADIKAGRLVEKPHYRSDHYRRP